MPTDPTNQGACRFGRSISRSPFGRPTPLPDVKAASRQENGTTGSARGTKGHPTVRTVLNAILLVALGVGIYGLLPRLGGVQHDIADLWHTHAPLVASAAFLQALSLAMYAALYWHVLRNLGAVVPYQMVVRVTLASFFVSHLTLGGSATGTWATADALGASGVEAATTVETTMVTSLISSSALVSILGLGLALAGSNHPDERPYILGGGVALLLIAAVFAAVLVAASREGGGHTLGRRVGQLFHRVRRRTDPGHIAQQVDKAVSAARNALTGRRLLASFGYATMDLLFDMASLACFLTAAGYRPSLGELAVAYGAANIASAIPVTPAGLGVIEVTLIATLVGFGAARSTATVAVLAYRLINYWLPLPFGGLAYLRVRLSTH